MDRRIEVVDYDPAWPQVFAELKASVWPRVEDFALSLEHVGSTSVPGLAAKPVIDMDIVVRQDDVPRAVERLAGLGYLHRGNLGIEGREAFRPPQGTPPHHLYVCAEGGTALQNHLALRDALRRDPQAARQYGDLKKRLAAQHPADIDAYIEGKTEFILGILNQTGLTSEQADQIRQVNRKTGNS